MSIEEKLGWTLLHSVWQIAALALMLAAFVRLARRTRPEVKYVAAAIALTACVVAPAITFLGMADPPESAVAFNRHNRPGRFHEIPAPAGLVASLPAHLNSNVTWRDAVAPVLPMLVRVWFVGLVLMGLRLAGGLFAIQRLKRRASELPAGRWVTMIQCLATQMEVKEPISLMLSNDVDAPAVIGLLKSVIILPASAVTRLSVGQIEALVAHEIAHIRRYDYLVNLIQSLVETVLFYHPGIWWISSVMRLEREHCCDEMAIAAIGDRTVYATALVEMEQVRLSAGQLAMAANGGSLTDRIRRIVLRPECGATPAPAWALVALGVVFAVGFSRSLYARQIPGSTNQVRRGGSPKSSSPSFDSNKLAGPKVTEATVEIPCHVVDADGKPAAGLMVEAWYKNEQGVDVGMGWPTDAKGDLSVRFPLAALSSLVFDAYRGDEFSDQDVIPLNGRVSIQLHHTKLSSVTGVIRDSKGKPLADVPVYAIFDGRLHVMGDLSKLTNRTTGPDGSYRFDGIYPGAPISIRAERPGLKLFQTPPVTLARGVVRKLPDIRLSP